MPTTCLPTVRTFNMSGEGGGGCTIKPKLNKFQYVKRARTQTNTTENITFPQLCWRPVKYDNVTKNTHYVRISLLDTTDIHDIKKVGNNHRTHTF